MKLCVPSVTLCRLEFEELRSSLFFSFFLSCKLLSSGWSSPSSGCTSCILLTLLRKAQRGSELGRKRALDREDETFSGFTIRFPRWLSRKRSHWQCRRHGFNPWVRKIPWRRKCNPLQYSCLENPIDRGGYSPCVVATHSGKQTHSEGQCR